MIDITNESFSDETKTGVVLVDFWATWCRPCTILQSVLERVETHFPSVKFVKVNVDECDDVAVKQAIGAIPTIKIFKDGVQVRSFIGVQKTESIEAILKETTATS